MEKRKGVTDEELQELIGKRLKNILTFLNLSSSQASKILGIAQSTLSRYLIGHYMPSADFIVKLYEHLKVNPLYILFGLEPMFVENLSLPTEESKGNISLSPFVRTFLQKVKEMFRLTDFQLYMLSKPNLSWDDFQKMLSEDFPIEPKTLQTLSCSFCADINAIFEEAVYRPFIIQVGTFGWDRKFEERKRNCPTEVDVLVIDIANTSHFYIWCMHGDYGGFILKVLYSYDDLDGLFWLLSKNLRAYISIDFSKDFEKQHPHITLTSQENYFYGNLMQGLGYLKDISSDHPAIKVLQRFIFLLQENL